MAGTQPAVSELLDPEFMQRLEQLELVSRKIFIGRMRGERRSKRRGQSVEFADYRNYVAGDDLRFLDWNIYGRLEKLFLRLFLEEEDLHVNILIDQSGSMNYGEPNKFQYARQVAAALAYIGLVNFDRVSLYGFAGGLSQPLTGLRGRQSMGRLVQHLLRMKSEGVSYISAACKDFAIRAPGKGVLVVLSDFFDKGGYEQGLRYLLGQKMDVYCLQVLAPQEMEPELAGDLRLVDMEDEDVAEVTVSKPLLDRYKSNLALFCDELREFCLKRGMSHVTASTETPFDMLVLSYLRSRGLIR
jgi:uncharacterized protein (DUF58 family)